MDLETKRPPGSCPELAYRRLARFTIHAAASISYGLLVFLVSVVTTVGLFALHLDYILLPAFASFMVVGPIIEIGLYEKTGAWRKAGPFAVADNLFRPESGGPILSRACCFSC